MPVAVTGTFIGVRLVRVIPQRTFYVLIHVALFLLSIKMVADGLR
jgi:uncharacterized membrane protein YfcA